MTLDLESLGSIPRAMTAVVLVLGAAWGLGSVWGMGEAALARIAARRAIDAALLRIVVGINLLAAIGVTLGQWRLLGGARSLWLLAGCCAIGAIVIAYSCRRQGRAARPIAGAAKQGRTSARWLAAPAGALALITLGPALCYPVGWDELVYHSELPRRWLADGHPAFYADLPYSGFPSLGEILFWLAAPLEGVIAPRLLVWACWAIGLALLYRVLRRRLRSGSAGVLTLAFAVSPATLMISANCYVESILMMNLAAILLALGNRPRAKHAISSSALIGVLAGGAAAVKLTGLAVVAAVGLWYLGRWCLATRRDRSRLWRALQSVAVVLAVAAIVALPFYVRPWLARGNPLYPYYSAWFTGDAARLEMSRYHHEIGGAAFGVRNVAALVTGPILLAFREQNYDGSFGWQLLGMIALAILALVAGRRRAIALAPAAVWLWLYVFWYLTAQQARFAAGAMLVLVVLAGLGLARVRWPRRKLLLAGLLIAAAMSLPWRTAGYYLASWLTVLGAFTQTQHVDEGTDLRLLPLVRAIAERTPESAKLMLLFEHRGFYVPRACTIGTPFFQEAGFTPPERFADPDRVLDLLKRERITHIVLTKGPRGPDWLPSWQARLDPLFQGIQACSQRDQLRVLWESDDYFLLEVRP